MKKFALLGGDQVYIESNLALIMINAHNFGSLEDLVILKSDSEICKKIDPTNQYTIIIDKTKNYMSDHLELLKVTEDDIEYEYLFYISQHELDGTRKVPNGESSNCCNKPIIENTDLCSDCKEHTEVVTEYIVKEDKNTYIKNKEFIKNISNIYFDTFEILTDNVTLTIDFLDFIEKFKSYLNIYGYRLIHSNHNYNYPVSTYLYSELKSGSIGKIFIVKDLEKTLKTKENKPLTLYVEKDTIGYIIGNKGNNVNKLKESLNNTNKLLTIPYIKLIPLEERMTNNDYETLKLNFKKVVYNFMKTLK